MGISILYCLYVGSVSFLHRGTTIFIVRNLLWVSIFSFQFEKFRSASQLTTKLASLASEESRRGFERRIALLKRLVSAWENGENVSLAESMYILEISGSPATYL